MKKYKAQISYFSRHKGKSKRTLKKGFTKRSGKSLVEKRLKDEIAGLIH